MHIYFKLKLNIIKNLLIAMFRSCMMGPVGDVHVGAMILLATIRHACSLCQND